MPAQAKKKFVEGTLPSAKKRKIRISIRKKTISQGMNQYRSSSLIVIDESPQVSRKYHNLLVLADVASHTMVNKEKGRRHTVFYPCS